MGYESSIISKQQFLDELFHLLGVGQQAPLVEQAAIGAILVCKTGAGLVQSMSVIGGM